MREQSSPARPLPGTPATRAFISLVVPFVAMFVVSGLAPNNRGAPLAAAGIISWFLGLYWYGLRGMGLRGHRPLYAGIGFAVLGWLAFLLVRYFTVEVAEYVGTGLGRVFLYLLLFEAFAVQLWAYGLFFRAMADWRGPVTAAITSGFLFGLIAYLFFQESFAPSGSAGLYFIVWGVLYGLIRLRTGSLLGIVIIQAMQSLTGWQLLKPFSEPEAGQLFNLYLVSGLLYLLIMWRLWPKREEDYRV